MDLSSKVAPSVRVSLPQLMELIVSLFWSVVRLFSRRIIRRLKLMHEICETCRFVSMERLGEEEGNILTAKATI
jgi:hypothetical protein